MQPKGFFCSPVKHEHFEKMNIFWAVALSVCLLVTTVCYYYLKKLIDTPKEPLPKKKSSSHKNNFIGTHTQLNKRIPTTRRASTAPDKEIATVSCVKEDFKKITKFVNDNFNKDDPHIIERKSAYRII
ncbi:MAG: hypothetical protein EPO11_00195 [Gammaproteobacteria bacterium]|nr:MAG: hypothetical protein EPO11_00195 [Gammaproteobacteria bacterium]